MIMNIKEDAYEQLSSRTEPLALRRANPMKRGELKWSTIGEGQVRIIPVMVGPIRAHPDSGLNSPITFATRTPPVSVDTLRASRQALRADRGHEGLAWLNSSAVGAPWGGPGRGGEIGRNRCSSGGAGRFSTLEVHTKNSCAGR